ncbi:MAG: MFS transporter [Archaeoglobus sp.]|nr:MAG: MFS transporter [Archaeoglobus sp.]
MTNENQDVRVRTRIGYISPWLSLIPVVAGVFMVVLDMSILMVALPKITQDFQATASDVQWLLNAYLITLVVLQTIFGKIGDSVRRDYLYATGMAIFLTGSYLSAKSWSIGVFILFRVIQAIGGAVIMGNSLALITELFPPGKRGTAMGVESILIAASFALGPVIGGWLTTNLSWHWVFYINVPVGLFGVLAAFLLFPPLGGLSKEPLDYVGVILLAVGLGFFTLAIIKGQDWGWWNRKTVWSFIISIAWLLAFIARELSYEYPVLDLSLFRIRNFTAPMMALFFMSWGMAAVIFLIPYYLQGVLCLTAETAGLWMLPISTINLVAAPLAGRLSDRVNPQIMMCLAPLIFISGLHMLANIGVNNDFMSLVLPFLALGSGIGLAMPAAMNVMMSAVPKEKAGMASGTIQTSNSLARSIGISFGGVVFTGKMNELVLNAGNRIPSPQEIKLLGLLAIRGNALPLLEIVDAFLKSLQAVFNASIPVILLALIIAAFFVRGREHLKKVGTAKVGIAM